MVSLASSSRSGGSEGTLVVVFLLGGCFMFARGTWNPRGPPEVEQQASKETPLKSEAKGPAPPPPNRIKGAKVGECRLVFLFGQHVFRGKLLLVNFGGGVIGFLLGLDWVEWVAE